MRKLLIAGVVAVIGLGASQARAAEGIAVPTQSWSFSGFGSFDLAALQRGFQVYREVCAGCHGLKYIAFRNLAELGYNADEVKAIAAEYTVLDGPDEDGEMFERPGIPADYFPSPFPNDNAARAANGGALPPDLSLIAKARVGGPDYLHALMTGYRDEPPPEFEGEIMDGSYYNDYFPGNQIAMPPPLFEDGVEYADGTPATVDQMSRDLSEFLMWAAEPTLIERKQMGIKVIIFLLVLTGLLYAIKRKVWADVH